MGKYTATVKLSKSQYEMLRLLYDKRITVTANTLVGLAVAEAVKRAAEVNKSRVEKYIVERGYAPITTQGEMDDE